MSTVGIAIPLRVTGSSSSGSGTSYPVSDGWMKTVLTLLLAKDQGLISNVKDILDELTAQGARISQWVYQEALAIAN